jgi:Kef-type K+ transport system membrane component KefB
VTLSSAILPPADPVGRFFMILGVMLAAGKLAAVLCERAGQPPVLGELLAGLILGVSGLGLIPTAGTDSLTSVVRSLAQVGVALLLFEVGLETELRALLKVGAQATAASVAGVVATFGLVVLYWMSPLRSHALDSHPGLGVTGVFVAAALTATSVGITARVFRDLRCTDTREARLILGAAVIDDVLGLVILSAAIAWAGGQALAVGGLLRLLTIGIGYLLAALALGVALAPRVFAVIDRLEARGALVVSSFALVLILSALADWAGSAPVIGAFAAGLVLSGTAQAPTISRQMRPVADIFVPIFFLSVGAAADMRALNPLSAAARPVLAATAVLVVLALAGKLAAGWAVPRWRLNRWAVGFGMGPRGEVSLVAANAGLALGVLTPDLLGALLGVVIATTVLSPILLTAAFGRWGMTRQPVETAS